MKSKVWALTKVFLKCSFANMGNKKDKTTQKSNPLKFVILYGFLIIYLGGVMGTLSYGLISSLQTMGQEQVFLSMFFLALGLLFLIQSIMSCMNIFYFSKDVEYVLPFPLKPKQILMAKFNVMLITEYITGIIFGLVPLVMYGIITGSGVIYYVMSAIALLLFPVLPLVVSAVLVMIIMSFAKITKDRDKFQVIASFIIIALVIGVQFTLTGNQELTDEQIALKLVEANGMVELIGNYVPTLKPIIQSLTNTNVFISILEMLKVVGITIISYVLFVVIGQMIYLKGALGNRSGGSTKHKKININKEAKKRKIGISYVIKEMKILFRNPIYFLQCVLPSFLMPVIMIGVIIASMNSGSTEETIDFTQLLTGISSTIIVAVIVGIIQFFTMMSYVSITAISRDGENAVFTKYIPVSLHKQFIYKAIPNIILNIIMNLVVFILVEISIPVPISLLIYAFILATLISIIQSFINLIIDLKKPKLKWDTEYAVVKQNMNLMWPAAFGMISIGIIVALTILFTITNLNGIIAFAITTVLLLVVIYILNNYIKNNQEKLFEKIY